MQSVTPLEVVRKDLPRSEAVDPRGTGGTSLQDGNPSVPQHKVNREVANERKSFKTPAVVLGDLTESQNQLPPALRSNMTIHVFKKQLKTFLFD